MKSLISIKQIEIHYFSNNAEAALKNNPIKTLPNSSEVKYEKLITFLKNLPITIVEIPVYNSNKNLNT